MGKALALISGVGGVTAGHSQAKSGVWPLLPHAEQPQPCSPVTAGTHLWGSHFPAPLLFSALALAPLWGLIGEPRGTDTLHSVLRPPGGCAGGQEPWKGAGEEKGSTLCMPGERSRALTGTRYWPWGPFCSPDTPFPWLQ